MFMIFDYEYNHGRLEIFRMDKKEALMKLLARQQKEVEETEELIKNLRFDSQGESTGSNITDSNFEAPSIAASILAGFDYGFVSRSEGCRFENVNDFNE